MSWVATAIIGSSIIGAGSSIFSANQANRAASDRTAAMARNAGMANQAIGDAIMPSYDWSRRGANSAANYLRMGYDSARPTLQNIANEYRQGVNALSGVPTSTNIGTASGVNPYINVPSQFNRGTDFLRNPNIGGHWDDLRSQNFFESPDYQFRKQEALDMVQGSAAGQGGLYSGQTLKDITDRASDLAAGEYGNWFARQTGLADRDYGADVSNYDRAAGQFADNYGRAAGQFGDNYNRLYGQEADNFVRAEGQFADQWNRDYTQDTNNLNRAENRYNDMINRGIAGISDLVNQGNAYYGNLADIYGNLYNQTGRDIMKSGYGYANNLMGVGQVAAQQPYVSPWGGINQAVQGGLNNYLWAQQAGLWGQPQATKPQAGIGDPNTNRLFI